MTSNHSQTGGDDPADASDGESVTREPEFEVREPDLWDDLGLERSDELPVPTSTDESLEDPATRRSESDGRIGQPTVMALLSHLSIVFGVPVFIAPFLLRRDSHSLHHAKAAAVVFFAFYAVLAVALSGWPALTPAVLLLYIPGLVGIYRALQGREAGFLGFGAVGEWLFPWPKSR